MAKTLSQLRTMVRSLADAEGDEHKSDSEITTWLNQGLAALHDLKVQSAEDYALTSTTFTLTTSSNAYTLPATFYSLKGVDYQDGERWIRVPQFNFAERDRYREDAGFDGTYRLWYNPTVTELSADGDTVEDRDHEYVVAYAARKCLQKEESDTRDVDATLATLTARIVPARGKRDVSGPRHIAEVRRSRDDDWFDTDYYDVEYVTGRAYRLVGSTLVIVGRGFYLGR